MNVALREQVEQMTFDAEAEVLELAHPGDAGRDLLLRSTSVDGRLAQPIEPPADRLLHALRDRELVRFLALPALPLAIDLPLLDERLDDFLDEKRIAFGLAIQRRREFAGDACLPEQRRQQRSGVGERQSAEQDARGKTLAIPIDQRRRKRMRAIELDLAIRAEDEHAVVAQMPQQIV